MGKTTARTKWSQNVKAFFFILNFISCVFLLLWWLPEFFSFFSIKIKKIELIEGNSVWFGVVALICYCRLYIDYLKNKRWKS